MGELLNVVEDQVADARVLSIDGEIDLGTAGKFEQLLVAAFDDADGAVVVVDLAGVTFLSSAGISALLRAKDHGVLGHHEAQGRGSLVAVVRRALQITGLLEVLSIHLTVEAAVEAGASQ
jgi:anti-anti-sigma factor